MNDLDSSASRPAASQPISSIAISRLRSFSQTNLAFGSAEAESDAFSEIFARMAVSTPPPNPVARDPVGEPDQSGEPNEDSTLHGSDESTDVRDDPDDDRHADVDSATSIVVVVPREETGEPQLETDADLTPTEVSGDEDEEKSPTVDSSKPTSIQDRVVKLEQSSNGPETIDKSPLNESQQVAKSETHAVGTPNPSSQSDIDSKPDFRDAEMTTDRSDSASASDVWGASDGSHEGNQDRRRERRETSRDDRSRAPDVLKPSSANPHRGFDISEMLTSSDPETSSTLGSGEVPKERLGQSLQRHSTVVAAITPTYQPATQPTVTASGRASDVGTANRSPSISIDPPGAERSAASTKSTKPAEKGADTADLMTRIKLIQRVSKAFQHLGSDGGVVRLRLAPAELGTVRIEMRIQQKKVDARVVADTEAAGSLLREHLPDLRARLEGFGLQIESIEVETDTTNGDGNSTADNSFSRSDQNSSGERNGDTPVRRSKLRSVSRQLVSATPSSSPNIHTASGGVDVQW